MSKIHFFIIATFCIICPFSSLSAKEDIKSLILETPNKSIDNSLYNKMEYLDSRVNKDNFGFISDYNNVLVDEIPIKKQLESIFKKIINQTAQNKTLIIQLRDFNLNDISTAAQKTGHCNIRLNLYEQKDSIYYPIAILDTTIRESNVLSSITNKLIDSSSNAITYFIMRNLTKSANYNEAYSLQDVERIEDIEKSKLMLYKKEKYVDGLYKDFKSFRNQTPYKTVLTPKFDKLENLKEVKATYETLNISEKLRPKDIFAVVINGKAFIATDKSYIPIFKEDNEITFWNDGSIKITKMQLKQKNDSPKLIYIGVGQMLGGLMFTLPMLTTSPYSSFDPHVTRVKMKLDHLNGHFIMMPLPISTPQK